jgi:hypothetical protein
MKIWIFAVLIIFASFGSSLAQKKYSQMGVRFKVTSGWKVGNEQPEKGAIYYSAEKEGDLESGLVSFVLIGYEFDLNSFLQLCMQNIENSATMNEGTAFTWAADTTDVPVGEFTARKVNYTVMYDKLAFSGSVLVFKGCGNMVMINPQGAVEDESKNRKGFETILATVKCKDQ